MSPSLSVSFSCVDMAADDDEKASWNYLVDDLQEMIRKDYCTTLTWHILSLTCKREHEHQHPVHYSRRSEQASVLQMAIWDDELQIVQWQVKKYGASEHIRWVSAFECGYVKMVEWLLDEGIVVLRTVDPWDVWCEVPFLHPYDPDFGPYLAAKEGHLSLLQFLVQWMTQQQRELSSLMHSVLMGALLGGQVHVLQWLVTLFRDTGLPILFQSLFRYERIHPHSRHEISDLFDPAGEMLFPFPISVLEWLWARPQCMWFRSFLGNEMFYRCFRFRWPLDNVQAMDTARWLNDKAEGKWDYGIFFRDEKSYNTVEYKNTPIDILISASFRPYPGYPSPLIIDYEIKR